MSKKDEKKNANEESEEKAIVAWRPDNIFEVFDDVWESFRREFRRWTPQDDWPAQPLRRGLMPRKVCADLVDTGTTFEVCAEVPGLSKDKIDITLTEDSIEISGMAETGREETDQGFVFRERGYSQIYRKLLFPEEIVPTKAKATLKEGVLKVTVPKKKPTHKVKKHKLRIE